MVGATNVEEADILDARLDRVGVYDLGLFLVIPTSDDGTGGTEVSTSGTAYGRIPINVTESEWNAAVEGDPSTKTGPKAGYNWTFDEPTDDWGEINGFGIWEGSTLRWYGELISPQTVLLGNPAPTFDATHVITVSAGDKSDTF